MRDSQKQPRPGEQDAARATRLAVYILRRVQQDLEPEATVAQRRMFLRLQAHSIALGDHPLGADANFYFDEAGDRAEPIFAEAHAGDPDAHHVLLAIADDLIDFGDRIGPRLARYLVDRARRPHPRRRRTGRHEVRNRQIALVVETICTQFSFAPTRNPGTADPCACSIVAEALCEVGIEISEGHVADVYLDREKKRAALDLN